MIQLQLITNEYKIVEVKKHLHSGYLMNWISNLNPKSINENDMEILDDLYLLVISN